jgi:hypothetical protein
MYQVLKNFKSRRFDIIPCNNFRIIIQHKLEFQKVQAWNLKPEPNDSYELLLVKNFFLKKVTHSEKGIMQNKVWHAFQKYQNEENMELKIERPQMFHENARLVLRISKEQKRTKSGNVEVYPNVQLI